MKITLLDVKGNDNQCMYKDWAGGFGTNFSVGDSPLAKAIEFAKRSGVNLPITSYGYIAAVCRNLGHDVAYASNEVPADSDVVVIQSSIVDYKSELKFADRIRGSTSAKVCFIGPFAAQTPSVYRKHADFIIKGEPEDAIEKICEGRARPGVMESAAVKDLDKLPFPDWDGFPVKRYSYFPAIRRKPVLPVLSSRGCLYACNYCPYKVQWNYRTRSPENVVDEIEHLVDAYGAHGVIFRDPLFTCDPKRAESIARAIIRRGIDIEWGCETRLDHLSAPLLETLHESGLRSIEVGVESFYDDILNAERRKPIAKKHQKEMVRECDRLGIRVAAFYIIGLPNDTLDTIKRTIEYAKSLNTDVASFAISTPFPGTEFYDHVKDKIYEKDWEKFTTYTPVYVHPNLSREQLLRLKEHAFVSYFYRPKYLLKFLGGFLK